MTQAKLNANLHTQNALVIKLNSSRILVPKELISNGGTGMKLIGIKSNDIEYDDVVHKGDIIICAKEMLASPGDLCIRMKGDQMMIAPYKKNEEYLAVIIQVIKVVKQLN